MRIDNIFFKDEARMWSLEKSSFNKLTLLVGASGVGKTQILKSIMNLKAIAEGQALSGVSWAITFHTLDNRYYYWAGKFENKGDIEFSEYEDDEIERNTPILLNEEIRLDNKTILQRSSDQILFNGAITVKLPQHQSALYLLKEEDLIKPAFNGFKKIINSDQSDSQKEPYKIRIFETQKLLKSLKTINKIQESKEDIRTKLYLTYKNASHIFQEIKARYIDIFPQIEDIKVEPLDFEDDGLPMILKEYPFIQIKEFGINKWIKQQNISSGMFRTLIHISEIYLCSAGSVFLIDEFENSLGINCINELTSDILTSERQLQYIITSHHPYIINNIHFDNWKLVTRNRGVIQTHVAKDFNLGNSKHDAFMQLLQLEEYQTGIMQ